MTEPVRWGILGASNFARHHMARAIHGAEGAVFTALATSDPAKAAPFTAFAPELRVHDSYDALLADPEIEAVYIPLPHTLHVEWSLKALAAGKHVLSEKPMALKASDIDPLIAARDRAGGLLATEAYMIVHHPQWQRARALLADGAVGRLRHVRGTFSYNNSAEPENIRNRPATGGGSLPDIGVYTIGSTRFATGAEPQEITFAEIEWENGVEVTTRASARFDGFDADWITSMRLMPQQEMVFHGDTGWMRLTVPFNARSFGEPRLELRQASGLDCVERFPVADQYVLQVEAFGRSIRDGAPYPWSLEDAKGTQRVIDAIHAKANKPA